MAQTKTETVSATKRTPRTLAGTVPATTDNGRAQILSHYEAALRLMQEGKYDKADYAFYGLAVLASMTGDSHTCLEHLTEAIRQNPRNRIQARADSDFQDMADDPRFTELLYPEV